MGQERDGETDLLGGRRSVVGGDVGVRPEHPSKTSVNSSQAHERQRQTLQTHMVIVAVRKKRWFRERGGWRSRRLCKAQPRRASRPVKAPRHCSPSAETELLRP